MKYDFVCDPAGLVCWKKLQEEIVKSFRYFPLEIFLKTCWFLGKPPMSISNQSFFTMFINRKISRLISSNKILFVLWTLHMEYKAHVEFQQNLVFHLRNKLVINPFFFSVGCFPTTISYQGSKQWSVAC